MENLNMKKELKRRFFRLLCFTIIFGISCLTFSSCSTQRGIRLRDKSIKEWSEYEWQEIKKSDENNAEKWTIYSRKVRDTNFLEYKIEGKIEASPKACLTSFIKDIHNQADDFKKFPTYEIVEQSAKSILTYVIHKEPFPLKNTEMSVRYMFFSNNDETAEVKWKEAWNESSIQPSKKLKRVEMFRGSWNFIPIANNSCKAVNNVQFELKGMPLWFAEPMVIKFLKEGLENTRKMTSNSQFVDLE